MPRDPRVWLAADVARCEPGPTPWCHRATCARYLAPIPAHGGIVADLNAQRPAPGLFWRCMHYLSAEQAIGAGPQTAPRRVLPPIGSSGGE